MLKEKLMEDLKKSMREKNEVRKNTVQMIRAAILQIEKDKGIEVQDEKILEIIAKEVKIKKDALVDFEKAQRQDLIKQTNEEISVLQEYLPKQLSKEELNEKIAQVIARVGATSIKDMGIVMKEAKQEIGTAADGKSINEVVKELLG
ncbi:MAG: GatB/YqeY domain-containing protein [Clostridia bacterium]|nr:GatB/YqeY domain-containing protein [Clostridia bacterium]